MYIYVLFYTHYINIYRDAYFIVNNEKHVKFSD